MTIGIRVDGGFRVGMGHVYKSLWLAEALGKKGCDVCFLSTEDAASLRLIERKNFRLEIFPSRLSEEEKVERVNRWAKENRPSFLIVDHWDWAEAYWSSLEKERGTVYVGVDVPPERFAHFDLTFQGIRNRLVNAEYTERGCRVYEGPKYLMTSPDFLPFAGAWKYRGRLQKILLAFGGSDIGGFSVKVLDYFEKTPNRFDLTLVLGPACPDFEKVAERWSRSRLKVEILRDAANLPEHMSRADLAVVAAGAGTLSELALVGAPAIAFAAVPHQIDNAENFSRVGGVLNCAKIVGAVDETFSKCMDDLTAEPERLNALSRKWAGLVDGQGINRMVAILEGYDRF